MRCQSENLLAALVRNIRGPLSESVAKPSLAGMLQSGFFFVANGNLLSAIMKKPREMKAVVERRFQILPTFR